MMQLISAPAVLLDRQLVPDGWVLHRDGRILDAGAGRAPRDADVVLPSGTLAPGLVDLQCNGAFGHDLADTDPTGWRRVLTGLVETGVTAVVPTIVTAPFDELLAALRTAPLDVAGDAPSAMPLGLHLEGPFLSARRRGAHRKDLLREPIARDVDAILDAGSGRLTYLTLAPELPGAIAAIGRVRAAGVTVSIGHSDATDGQAREAVDAGATLVTHLYNAQRPLSHRDPGVVGVALSDARLTLGLIADLDHVAPTAVRVAFAAAAGRVALVTDSIPTLGLPPGRYCFGGGPVLVSQECRPPHRDDGTLAGSSLRLDHAVRNVIGCGVDPAAALAAATTVPADAVGATDHGRLAPGARADLTWFDADWRLRATWLAGRQVVGAMVDGAMVDDACQGSAR